MFRPFMRLLLTLFFAVFCFSAQAYEDDRWDELMEQATEALRSANLPAARKSASEAARQGRYENADRHVTALALLSRIEQEAGDLVAAEQSLRQAIEIINRVPGPLQEDKAVLHNNLGALLDLAGDLPAAEQHYRAALALYQTLPAVRAEGRFSLLTNLAGLLERRGDAPAARALYLQAEALLPQLPGSSSTAGITLNNNLGALLHRSGDIPGALSRFTSALAIFPADATQTLLRASLLHNLGTAELESGALVPAKQHLNAAEGIRRARLGPLHADSARTFASLALLQEQNGQLPAALGLAREATTAITSKLNVSAGTRAAAASALERREWRDAFATHLRLLSLAEPDATRRATEALALVQTVKHGELARVFAGASLAGDGELGVQTRAIRAQFDRFQLIERELVQELQATTTNERRERNLRDQLASEREQLDRLQRALQQNYPRYHELVSGQVASLASVQAALTADEAVLVFLGSRQESFLVAITRDAARLVRAPLPQAALIAAVSRIRRSVEPEHADGGGFAFADAAELHRQLLAPAADILDGRGVWFIVPDGALESLPFALLLKHAVTPAERKDLRLPAWLIRQHALVTLPSLGALTLARNTPPPPAATEPLLAFADPMLGEGAAAQRKVRNLSATALWAAPKILTVAPVTAAAATAPIVQHATTGKRLGDPELIRQLAPLPETADEARAIAQTLGGGELLLRQNAVEKNVRQRDLSRYRNLLFATHGAMASDFIEFGEPALVLTPPAIASEDDDGLLSASEIAQLKLNADWVLLSACNTAAADGSPGAEGLSGLAKAFFHAGARSLLVSHWSVVSESTVQITTGAFSRLTKNPAAGKARALQQSILSLLDNNPGFRHPMFWAPFVLVGDAR
jgi:CHAT domain-containing protein